MHGFYKKWLPTISIGMFVWIILAGAGLKRGSILIGVFAIYIFTLAWASKRFKLSWWMALIVAFSTAQLMRVVLQYLEFKGWM